jgi:hypothetical protein
MPASLRTCGALPPRGNDTVVLRPWQADDLPTVAEASTDPNHAQSPGGSAIDPGLATWD